jgi:hypothetical protein
MSRINDGGAAFPRPHSEDKFNDEVVHSQPGMTLRDWFAGRALCGMTGDENMSTADAARLAYEYADDMLERRER